MWIDSQQQTSTGHGTVHLPWSEDVIDSVRDNSGYPQHKSSTTTSSSHKKKDQEQENKEHTTPSSGFGHTTKHQHAPRSIKRDLNDI